MLRTHKPGAYETDGSAALRAWLEQEKVTNGELVERLRAEGIETSQQNLNRRINGQQEISIEWGLALHKITGIAPILFRTPEERVQLAGTLGFKLPRTGT